MATIMQIREDVATEEVQRIQVEAEAIAQINQTLQVNGVQPTLYQDNHSSAFQEEDSQEVNPQEEDSQEDLPEEDSPEEEHQEEGHPEEADLETQMGQTN
ncbi:hypothetical protein EDB89DRAFT_2071886 [Lactarius sanguifluus]|nr:hypothetical protein EDB89DRAFT_2071886 [Lactarius sanguifluus]